MGLWSCRRYLCLQAKASLGQKSLVPAGISKEQWRRDAFEHYCQLVREKQPYRSITYERRRMDRLQKPGDLNIGDYLKILDSLKNGSDNRHSTLLRYGVIFEMLKILFHAGSAVQNRLAHDPILTGVFKLINARTTLFYADNFIYNMLDYLVLLREQKGIQLEDLTDALYRTLLFRSIELHPVELIRTLDVLVRLTNPVEYVQVLAQKLPQLSSSNHQFAFAFYILASYHLTLLDTLDQSILEAYERRLCRKMWTFKVEELALKCYMFSHFGYQIQPRTKQLLRRQLQVRSSDNTFSYRAIESVLNGK